MDVGQTFSLRLKCSKKKGGVEKPNMFAIYTAYLLESQLSVQCGCGLPKEGMAERECVLGKHSSLRLAFVGTQDRVQKGCVL